MEISERPTGLNWCKFRGSFSFVEGLHFTKEKIDKYFSNHVHDFATIAAPLQELIKQYDKRKKKK